MSKTYRSNFRNKSRMPKFADSYSGYYGEGWGDDPRGRKDLKREVHRSNRRFEKRALERELAEA